MYLEAETNAGNDISDASALLQKIINDEVPGSAVIMHQFFDLPVGGGRTLRVIGISTQHQWAYPHVKPSSLTEGRFIQGPTEVMMSLPWTLEGPTGGATMVVSTNMRVGSTFSLRNGGDSRNYTIVGAFNQPFNDGSNGWLLVSDTPDITGESPFDRLRITAGLDSSLVRVQTMTFIAPGDVFLGGILFIPDAYLWLRQLSLKLEELRGDPGTYGDWRPAAPALSFQAIEATRTAARVSLIMGILGTGVIATVYGYLITRFRKDEVAVLKTIGYRTSQIRVVLLGEILTVAFLGFVTGVLIIQIFFLADAFFGRRPYAAFSILDFQQIIPIPRLTSLVTTILALTAIVLASIPGFFLVSTRILSGRPIDVMRTVA